MADPQPIVCAYLKLPPEQQTFFRMREIPLVFIEKLDRLSLVLAASHDTHPSPVAIQIMRDLRENAGEQCKKLSGVMYSGYRFASVYTKFLRALSPDSVGERTFLDVFGVNNNAHIAATDMEGTQKSMIKFKQDIASAVSRITEVLSEDKESLSSTVFTAENSRDVMEFMNAVDECSVLLGQAGDYYREIERQTKDEESIESDKPSNEEIKIMRERWSTFSTSINDLKDGFGTLQGRILRGGVIQRIDDSQDNARTSGNAAPAGHFNPTDIPNGQKAIADASASDPSPSTDPKTSRWRSFWSRIFSCLTLKYFS